MKIEEMAQKYAEQRIKSRIPVGYQSYTFELQKEQYIFDGYDIDDAVEYGANAVLKEIENILSLEYNTMATVDLIVEKVKELKGKSYESKRSTKEDIHSC